MTDEKGHRSTVHRPPRRPVANCKIQAASDWVPLQLTTWNLELNSRKEGDSP